MPLTTMTMVAGAYASMELGFAMFWRMRSRAVQGLTKPPVQTPAQRERIFGRAMQAHAKYGADRFVGQWFGVNDMKQVKQENMRELVSWSLFQCRPDQLTPEQENEQQILWDKYVTGSGLHFEPGRTPGMHCMRHTLDPVKVTWRPGVVYALLHLLRCLGYAILRLSGFRRYRQGSIRYWYRGPQRGADATTAAGTPMVFLHGLGIGLLPYLPFLLRLPKTQTAFLVEQPWMSMQLRYAGAVPSIPKFTSTVQAMLARHHCSSAVFAAHSMGSCAVSWLLEACPGVVQRVVLLDPVTILLCLPTTCYSFLYRPPQSALAVFSRNFVGRELGVSSLLHRHLWWYRSTLWPEALPPRSTVVLGEKDRIVPGIQIRALCEEKGNQLNVIWLPKTGHGGFLASSAVTKAIIHAIVDGPEAFPSEDAQKTKDSVIAPKPLSRVPLRKALRQLPVNVAAQNRGPGWSSGLVFHSYHTADRR
eukprot:RCo016008